MRYSSLAVLLLLLPGCETAREAAADALQANEYYMCRVSPVGAVKDRYGASQELTDAYNTICDPTPKSNVIGGARP